MKPEPTFPRCNAAARRYSPIGYARCPACLRRYGAEGFAKLPHVEADLRCDEPLWDHPEWVAWRERQRQGWRSNAPVPAP